MDTMIKALMLGLAMFNASLLGQDIEFTNKVVTFTNLQGEGFKDVRLVRGDRLGLVWRDDSGGGRVLYTNLSPAFLSSIGISQDRIKTGAAAIAAKAAADARFKALRQTEGAKEAAEMAKWQAGAPQRQQSAQKAAQKQADLNQIQQLDAQVRAAEYRYNHNSAAVHDANMASLGDPTAPILYMSATLKQNIDDAKETLEKAKAAYRSKYGEEP